MNKAVNKHNELMVQAFIELIEKIGDIEQLYLDCLFFDEPVKQLVNKFPKEFGIEEIRLDLNDEEVSLLKRMHCVSVYELNKAVNDIRNQRILENKHLRSERMEQRRMLQLKKFEQDYEKFYHGESDYEPDEFEE